MSAARRPPRYWFDGSAPPFYARAVAEVYGAVVAVRRALFRRGWLHQGHPGVPVVVVGNLIAGGSGKTPLTIAIVERLRAEGWTPGVASRGYGRRDAATPRWVQRDTDPADGGDEPVLIARRTGVRVRVDRDRLAAARALAAEGCDIVVCDDGLQHYRLMRDIEIEVVDGRRRYGNGKMLPAGPLREPPSRAARCDFRVVNLGTTADTVGSRPADSETPNEAGFGEWPMRLAVADAQALRGARTLPMSSFVGQRVHAVAGIGEPERFFETLRSHGIGVVPHGFSDHHRYVADDLRFGSDLPVLMTEKDAVKCVGFAEDGQYSVAIRADLPEAFWVAFFDRIKRRSTDTANAGNA